MIDWLFLIHDDRFQMDGFSFVIFGHRRALLSLLNHVKRWVMENGLLSQRNFPTITIIIYSRLDFIDDIKFHIQFDDKDSSGNRLAIHVFLI
jgi:hypothetical protein